jgi:hypothetical protein
MDPAFRYGGFAWVTFSFTAGVLTYQVWRTADAGAAPAELDGGGAPVGYLCVPGPLPVLDPSRLRSCPSWSAWGLLRAHRRPEQGSPASARGRLIRHLRAALSD